MDHHWVPQNYLEPFEVPNEPVLIWVYDKQDRQFKKLPIKTVVRSPGYYDDDVGRELNRLVEHPAQSVLKRLRQGAKIPAEARQRASPPTSVC